MKNRNRSTVTFTQRGSGSEDISGNEYNSWTVKKFYGKRLTTIKGRTTSVELWECQCKCGHVANVLKPNLVNNRSKQCTKCQAKERSSHADPDALPRRNMKVTFHRMPKMDPPWDKFNVFWEWVKTQNRAPHSKLLRHDPMKPHGPENSYFGSDRQAYDADLAIIAKAEEWTPEQAAEWAAGVSRQRVQQAADAIQKRYKELHP